MLFIICPMFHSIPANVLLFLGTESTTSSTSDECWNQQARVIRQTETGNLLPSAQHQLSTVFITTNLPPIITGNESTINDNVIANDTVTFANQIERLVEISDPYRTIVAVLYSLTAIVAFVSNLLALIILNQSRRTSRQLNLFLSNLGLSDIMFALFNIPFTYITLIYNTWWLPEFLCPLTNFVQVLAPTVAFYTLIAIGIGRYYVIVTGKESLFLSKSSHTKIAIAIIWLMAILVALPLLLISKISPVVYENQTYVECLEDWTVFDSLYSTIIAIDPASTTSTTNTITSAALAVTSTSINGTSSGTSSHGTNSIITITTTTAATATATHTTNNTANTNTDDHSIGKLYTIILFIITFILPVVALTYLYGHIGIIVYKHQFPVDDDNRITNQNLTQTKVKVLEMLLLLVVSFIICWTPGQIFYLMLWLSEDIRQDTNEDENNGGLMPYSTLYYTMYFIFHWLSCSHTIMNPFIYCFFSNNFKASDLLNVLLCKGNQNTNHQTQSKLNHQLSKNSLRTSSPPNDSIIIMKNMSSIKSIKV